ncbi:BamA/TamA family outer membrane protein [Nibribacter ruber]|uniref:BamA/TamA family outer membrane protein n=1 Tax=Nibribacter ruber TaxID=2698458 RepID=A0A6P1P0B7_9BACT|nr:BamA/TamA family outer membrane protein [Nibribacter ruber]QHL86382.1 BamA/TamA family outer membrane protein [Nibribacter ruber]
MKKYLILLLIIFRGFSGAAQEMPPVKPDSVLTPAPDTLLVTQPVPVKTTTEDTLRETKSKWDLFPILYYTPETQFAFGVKAIYVKKFAGSTSKDRPSSFPLTFTYTTQKQIIVNANADIWKQHNARHLQAWVGYSIYPYFFYGVGNDTPEEDEEEFTSHIFDTYAQYEQKVLGHLYLGGRYEFRHETVPTVAPEGQLATKDILGSTGTRASGLGPVLSYDTRDHLYFPRNGVYHQLSYLLFNKALGSESNFSRYRLDLRKYLGIKRSVLAGQAYFNFTTGNMPFQYLSYLGGGNVLRGFLEARYRDRHAMVYQLEYRAPLYKRIGIVGFAATGQVVPSLKDYSFADQHLAAGGGLRYRLNEEGMNIRMDVAVSKAGNYVYFSVNEAF